MNKFSTFFSKHLIRASYLLLLILLIPSFIHLQAQSFDHESYPKLDFNFTHLELELGLQPQNLNIDGAATYRLEANVSEADTVILYAARLDISSVTVDEEQVDFSLNNDSLFVPLNEPSEAGDTYELYIRYSGSPNFGLLKNSNGTVWTSQLPKAQRHWVPIVDNPHVSLQTSLNISVPSGYSVQASGSQAGQEAASVDVVNNQFSTEEEIPASTLSFSVGRYDTDTINADNRNLVLSVEQTLTDSIDSQTLIESAAENIREIEDTLQLDYPHSELNIILLEDHTWETKSWGASTIFLYQNRGDLQAQLMRGLLAQWYGINQREALWSDGDVMTINQALALNTIADSTIKLRTEDSPQDSPATIYDIFGARHWNSWQDGLSSWKQESLKAIIAEGQPDALEELPRVVNWNNYAEYWYQKSGQPLFEIPSFSVQSEETGAEQSIDSVTYQVNYSLNESEDQLTFSFSATNGGYDKLTSLNVIEVYSDKTDTSEVTFTGAEDSVVVQVNPMINTLYLESPEELNLKLDEYKPADFLIYELRNAESVEQRAQAARKLGHHDDNSDLQLAIKDFMSNEMEPEVQASLLQSFADITKGATGTEQTFLNALGDQNKQIRDAALMALQNYPDNPSVLQRVEQLAVSADDMNTFKKATKVLTTLASAEEFEVYTENVIDRDTLGTRSVFAVQEMANMGAVEEAVNKASLFLDSQYKYEIRSRGLNILIQHDHSPSQWLSRAKELFTDTDPRIRYLFVQALETNMDEEVTDYLKENIQDEYDARVYQEIRRLISSDG